MNDQHLARIAAAGDPDALHTLVERHGRDVRRWTLSAVGQQQIAEELAQDTWVHVVRSLGSFDSKKPFLPWLRTVVRNLCRDHRKRGPAPVLALASPMSPTAAEDHLDASRALERAREGFATLTERQREAYVLVDIEGRPTRSVAALMEIEVSTLRALLHQGRTRIRAAILEVS